MSSDSALRVEGVSRAFGAVEVFNNLNLEVQKGEFVEIVGPSGCGKSTLLNLLSAFDTPDRGAVVQNGKLRMIYQQGGLFPWLTVAQNIGMGLGQDHKDSKSLQQLDEMLELIGLKEFRNQFPHRLSGGMRQRVELGRALVGETDILLMDEPFSALDYLTRLRMRRELTQILSRKPCTVVLVTHDIEEAAQLADRLVVLSERPARIRCEIKIKVPHPRPHNHPEIVDACQRTLSELGLEELEEFQINSSREFAPLSGAKEVS